MLNWIFPNNDPSETFKPFNIFSDRLQSRSVRENGFIDTNYSTRRAWNGERG